MKLYSIVGLCLLFFDALWGQKMKLDNNKLYIDDEYCCNVTEKATKTGHNSIFINGLDGKKWMEAHYFSLYQNDSIIKAYKLTFYPQNRFVYYKEGMELKKTLCFQLVKSGAITKTGSYDKGIDKFEQNFGIKLPKLKETPKKPDGKYKTTLVERDRNAAIFVTNGLIKQDFKLIGTFKEAVLTKNDTAFIQITFMDIKGLEIAKASFEQKNADTAILYIYNLKEPMTVNLNKGDTDMKVEEIVKQLIFLKEL
jgi:hypothetical protein